jgi:Flp pilus assembly protein protease CpaA
VSLAILAAYDIKKGEVPAWGLIPIPVGFVVCGYIPVIEDPAAYIAAALLFFAVFLSMAVFFGGGGGDAVMAGVTALFYGISATAYIVFLAGVAALAHGTVRKISGKGVFLGQKFPYAPFFLIGYISTVVTGMISV